MNSILTLPINTTTVDCQSSLRYKDDCLWLDFIAKENTPDIHLWICNTYKQGNLLKDVSISSTDMVKVSFDKSVIEAIKSNGRVIHLKLNRVDFDCKDINMEYYFVINMPPSCIDGLNEKNKVYDTVVDGNHVRFEYNDENATILKCGEDIKDFIIGVISFYFCCPVEILQEYRIEDNRDIVTIRSSKRIFHADENAAKFHSKTDSFAEFLGKVKLTHPRWRDFPRYARQYVDSTFVSEPQRYCMLFAMISSFAEYILESRKGEKGHPSGDQLAENTFKHFGFNKSDIDDIIKDKGLKRGDSDIKTVAELRNESEHNLFSNLSYAFLEDNPKINLFMEEIASRIIFDFIQVEYS